MTARKAGKIAADGIWVTLKRLREQWMLLVFLATALYWARDFIDAMHDLPSRLERQERRIAVLAGEIATLGDAARSGSVHRPPVLAFPGTGHGIDDGRPGEQVVARLSPAQWLRDDCVTTGLAAFMIDAGDRWFSVTTSLARLPQLSGSQNLAFRVTIHPGMVVGRAQFLLQVTQDCGTHHQVDSTPRLHFRVLASQNPIR